MKKPWLAALLNVISGVGYIYLDKKRALGWLLSIGTVVGLITWFDPSLSTGDEPTTLWLVLGFLGLAVTWAAFIVDGYVEAVKMNRLQKPTGTKVQKAAAAKAKVSTKAVSAKNDVSLSHKGLLLASLTIPVGIVAWDALWYFNFMASIVSFGIAFLAVKLYTLGAGGRPSIAAAKPLLAVIVAGVALSFLSGMAMDAQYAYSQQFHVSAWQAFSSLDFWNGFVRNVAYIQTWWSYAIDIIIAIVFAGLGCWSIARNLFVQEPAPVVAPAQSVKKKKPTTRKRK